MGFMHTFTPTRAIIEAMEPRRLLSLSIVITNQGTAHDSFGDVTPGYTGFVLTAQADPGQLINVFDIGQFSNSTNGIFGPMLQDWIPRKTGVAPTPVGATPSDTNGGPDGTDSHCLVVANRVEISAPFEDSDNIHPAGAPPNDAGDSWGTGSYMHGLFGIAGTAEVNSQPLAYVVLKNGATGTFSLDVIETGSAGQVTQHINGQFGTTGQITASISGTVYEDANVNHLRNAGEAGVQGVRVYVDANKNGVFDSTEKSTFTDAAGKYTIGSLASGTDRVRLVQADAAAVIDSPAAGYYDVTVASGNAVFNYDFARTHAAVVSGSIFIDEDFDKKLDEGDIGLDQWTVWLDFNRNNKIDAGEPTTTTRDGAYTLLVTAPLSHPTVYVNEVPQSPFKSELPLPPTASVAVAPGKVVTNWNIANFMAPATGEIDGIVFNDLNANGVRDTGEPGVAGQLVFLDENKDGQQDGAEPIQVTDANGRFSFTVLPSSELTPTSYLIGRLPQFGWRQTHPAPGGELSAPVRQFDNINAGAFGITQRAVISGIAFNDLDGNKLKGAGEPALANVRVYIDANNNGRFDSGETSVLTDANGNWAFDNLAPGTYLIRAVAPSGYKQDTTTIGAITVNLAGARRGLLIGFRKIV
jgi:hypothetical protein